MKLILFALLAVFAMRSHAEDSIFPVAQSTNTETHIYATRATFEHGSRKAIYEGNVIVDDPRVHITCDLLTAQLPDTGKRIDSIIAETNVVMLIPNKGVTNRATGDKAVYTFAVNAGVTNELLVLTGSPAIESPDGTMTGTKITWDRVRDTLSAENSSMVYRGTNAPAMFNSTTNAVPEPKPTKP